MARPAPPSGYHICAKAPQTPVMLVGGPYQHTDLNWKYWNYEDTGGSGLIFIKMASLALSDEYWLYPSSVDCGAVVTGTTAKTQKIKEMQAALNAQGYGLAVDGALGPNTCGAAYDYQSTIVGVDTHQLTGDFFVSLGLPSSYAVVLGEDCTPWWQGEVPPWIPEPEGGETVVVTPQPAPTPLPEPELASVVGPVAGASKKTLAAVLGAVGGALVGLAIKAKWYPRTQSWAAAGAGGAAGLGAGLLVGMTAFKDEQQSTVARLGLIQARKRKIGLIQARKKKLGLIQASKRAGVRGYIPAVVQFQWDKRGSVGFAGPDGKKKYW